MPGKGTSPSEDMSAREIVITRLLDAPRDMVWDAWTDPAQVVQWWGPRGFTTTIQEMDVRPGGIWRHTMHGPDGRDYPNLSTFQEVVKPKRIVFSHGGGTKGAPSANFIATWTFEAEGKKTRITMRSVFPTAEARDIVERTYHAIEGGKQTLDRLEEKLAGTPVVIERVFDAPVETVWKAITEVDQMKRWWDVPTLESFKPQVGFETEFATRCRETEFMHIWKVTEVVPGTKIAYDWKYVGFPGSSTVTFELSAEGKRTRLKLVHSGMGTFEPMRNPDLARGNFLAGWTSLMPQLAQFVEGIPEPSSEEFTLSRVFDAPRELVWKAFTDPDHMKNWWGPKGFTVIAQKMDFRPGGSYHYGMKSPDGHAMWGKFVYREIVPPERIVLVNSFSDEDGGLTRHPMAPSWPAEMLSIFTFTEHEGKTTFMIRWKPYNPTEEETKTFEAGRPGMNQGWGGTFEQLENYLARIQA